MLVWYSGWAAQSYGTEVLPPEDRGYEHTACIPVVGFLRVNVDLLTIAVLRYLRWRLRVGWDYLVVNGIFLLSESGAWVRRCDPSLRSLRRTVQLLHWCSRGLFGG